MSLFFDTGPILAFEPLLTRFTSPANSFEHFEVKDLLVMRF